MKYLIIGIVIIISLKANAQSKNDNFVLDEGKVCWQKVYETAKTKEAIISYFKNSGLFKLFRVEDGKIIATLRPQVIDKSKTGVAGIPPIVVKTDYMGTVIISFKEKKYRVVFQNILLVGQGDIIAKGEKQKFEKHYVSKDGTAFRKFFNSKPKPIYSKHFNTLFLIEKEKPKDDW